MLKAVVCGKCGRDVLFDPALSGKSCRCPDCSTAIVLRADDVKTASGGMPFFSPPSYSIRRKRQVHPIVVVAVLLCHAGLIWLFWPVVAEKVVRNAQEVARQQNPTPQPKPVIPETAVAKDQKPQLPVQQPRQQVQAKPPRPAAEGPVVNAAPGARPVREPAKVQPPEERPILPLFAKDDPRLLWPTYNVDGLARKFVSIVKENPLQKTGTQAEIEASRNTLLKAIRKDLDRVQLTFEGQLFNAKMNPGRGNEATIAVDVDFDARRYAPFVVDRPLRSYSPEGGGNVLFSLNADEETVSKWKRGTKVSVSAYAAQWHNKTEASNDGVIRESEIIRFLDVDAVSRNASVKGRSFFAFIDIGMTFTIGGKEYQSARSMADR